MTSIKTCLIHRIALLTITALALYPPVTFSTQQDVWRLDLSEPLTYFIADGSVDSGFQEGDRRLAEWALEAWGKQSYPPLRIVPGAEATATIRIYWVPAGSGLYGEMRGRLVEGRRGADVFVHPNTDNLGPDIAQKARSDSLFRATVIYLTCVHELGHAFGLRHTNRFADIMYSFEYGGDFVAYFMRFREKIEAWDHIPEASPFSTSDARAYRYLYPPTGRGKG